MSHDQASLKFDVRLLEEFQKWVDGPSGIKRPKEIKLIAAENPDHGFSAVLDFSLSNTSSSSSNSDFSLEPTSKRIAKTFISHIEVPQNMLLNASFQSNDPLVISMKQELLKLNPKFFDLDDLAGLTAHIHKPIKKSMNTSDMDMEINDTDMTEDKESDYSKGPNLTMHPSFVLTLWYTISQLRDPNSKWRPYLNLLPKKIPTPLFWKDDELSIAAGTNLYEGALQLEQLLKRVHQTLVKVDSSITLEEIFYGYTLFSSRAFAVSTDKSKQEIHTHIMVYDQSNRDALLNPALVEACLVPYADIFNHSPSSRVQFLTNNANETFNLDIETIHMDGAEIFSNYGYKSNESLILGYGFMVDGRNGTNPHNSFWVQMAIDERDPNRKKKLELIKQQGLEMRHHIKTDGIITKEMMATMRICLLNDYELYYYEQTHCSKMAQDRSNGQNKVAVDNPNRFKEVSFINEIKLYETLEKLLKQRLGKIKGPQVDEDRRQFEAARHQLSYPSTMAWQYRIEQKEIISAAIVNIQKQYFEFASKQALNCPRGDQVVPAPIFERIQFPAPASPDQPFTKVPAKMHDLYKSWKLINTTINDKDRFGVPEQINSINISRMACQFPSSFSVPNDWIINKSQIIQSKFGMVLQKLGVWDMMEEDMLIAIFILYQLHTVGEKYHEYFKNLAALSGGRQLYMNAMAFHDNPDMLSGTPAGAEVAQALDVAEQQYHKIFSKHIKPLHPNFADESLFSEKHYFWAYCFVLAEGVELMVAETDDEPSHLELSVLPIFGMTKYYPCTTYTVSSSQSTNCTSLRSSFPNPGFSDTQLPIIYTNFDSKDNHTLLADHGFVADNPTDTLPVVVPIDEDDLTDRKIEILERWALNIPHYLSLSMPPTKYMSALRISMLTSDELDLFATDENKSPFDKISDQNEARMIDLFGAVISDMLMPLRDSIKENEKSRDSETDPWLKSRLDLVCYYKSTLIAILEQNARYKPGDQFFVAQPCFS